MSQSIPSPWGDIPRGNAMPGTTTEDMLPRRRLAIIAGLAVASWTPFLLIFGMPGF